MTAEDEEAGVHGHDLDRELSAYRESQRAADRRLAGRYGTLARVAYGAGLVAFVVTLAMWAVGAISSSDALFRVLLVAGAVFVVCGILLAKLAEVVFTRRTSPPRRGSADPPP
ncbi:MAG: hypothetical protein IT198_02400 [Acidimicrobiia bacterium]|nr:hypothetical protein [Acidimicrobiia bacterium]